MKPSFRSIVAALACAAAACKASNGDQHTYEIGQLFMPATENDAGAVAIDLDGDGLHDNALGLNIAVIVQAANGAINPGTLEASAIGLGQVITLLDVRTPNLGNADGVVLTEYQGAPSGDGVEVAADSPLDASMTGPIVNGNFAAGPGEALLVISLFDSAGIPLRLHGAHASFLVQDQGLAQGVLAGGVLGTDLTDHVFPAISAGMTAQIGRDCPGGAPPSCGCTAGSRGAAYVSLFDLSPANCSVSADEVANAPLVKTLLAPDVLIGPGGAPCLSFAIGFSAQQRDFAVP
jgi:hypothetical protein